MNALLISSARAFARPREILRLRDVATVVLNGGGAVDLLTPRSTPLLAAAMPSAVRVFTVPNLPLTDLLPNRPSLRAEMLDLLLFFRAFTLATRRVPNIIHGVDDGAAIAHAVAKLVLRPLPYVADFLEPHTRRGVRRGPLGFLARHSECAALRSAAAVIFPGEEDLANFDGPVPLPRVSFLPDPHTDLFSNTLTFGEFAYALEHLYAYALRSS